MVNYSDINNFVIFRVQHENLCKRFKITKKVSHKCDIVRTKWKLSWKFLYLLGNNNNQVILTFISKPYKRQ